MLTEKAIEACNFDIEFGKKRVEPSGASFKKAGTTTTLLVPDDGGKLLIIEDLHHTTRGVQVVEDEWIRDEYRSLFGDAPDLEGIAVIDATTSIVYLAVEHAGIIEYDYEEKKIRRMFDWPKEVKDDIKGTKKHGIESIDFVPANDSPEGGYFYVGSQKSGTIYIVEVPIKTSPQPITIAPGELIPTKYKKSFEPHAWNNDASGLSYANGYVFLNYGNGDENIMIVYAVDPRSGMPDEAGRAFEGKTIPTCEGVTEKVPCVRGHISDAEGIAVRARNDDDDDEHSWEVLFISDTHSAVYGYLFDFEHGFKEHPYCTGAAAGSFFSLNSLAAFHFVLAFFV